MIAHKYKNASDNRAQWEADQIGRQEVTGDWWREHMCDEPLFAWTSDFDAEMGLDPWRIIDGPDDLPNARLFVQRKDMNRLGLAA